jgi:hypothetical protein
MKNVKSILMGAGSVVLAGLSLALFAPRAAHALAATLVQVTNTSANPVIGQDVDSPGRSPYYQTVSCYSASTNQCEAFFPAVPANMRLVVQYINSSVDTPTALQSAEFDVGGTIFMPILHTLQGNDSAGNKIYVASQPMLYYFEAGQQPRFVDNAQAGSFTFMSGAVTLTGYLVNLTQ